MYGYPVPGNRTNKSSLGIREYEMCNRGESQVGKGSEWITWNDKARREDPDNSWSLIQSSSKQARGERSRLERSEAKMSVLEGFRHCRSSVIDSSLARTDDDIMHCRRLRYSQFGACNH